MGKQHSVFYSNMVSLRCFMVSALVLISVAGVSATYSIEPTSITRCHKNFYRSNGLELNVVLKVSLGFIEGILKAIGLIWDFVNGALSEIFGLFGFLKTKPPKDIDHFIVKPNTKGGVINFYLQVCFVGYPLYDKINNGLGALFLKVCVGLLVIGASSRDESYEGLNFKPLAGNEKEWPEQLGLAGLGKQWDRHCNSIGGIKILTGVKLRIYKLIDILVKIIVKLSLGLLEASVEILDKVMEIITKLTCILCNVIDDAGEEASECLTDYSSNLYKYVDVKELQVTISSEISVFDSSQYSECFSA